MTQETRKHAGTTLLSGFWQAGRFGASLPPTTDKLERPCRLYRRNRRAAAAAAFAIVAAVLSLLVFGVIEYGGMVMVPQLITSATHDRARKAMPDGSTTANVESKVNEQLTSRWIEGATVTVAPNPPAHAEYGDPVTVTASIPFDQVSWLSWPMNLGGKTLIATTVMRCEVMQ